MVPSKKPVPRVVISSVSEKVHGKGAAQFAWEEEVQED